MSASQEQLKTMLNRHLLRAPLQHLHQRSHVLLRPNPPRQHSPHANANAHRSFGSLAKVSLPWPRSR